MRDPKRDEEFKGLMEGVIDSLNKSIEEDDLWWEKNKDKVRENTLKELKEERQQKIYKIVSSVIVIVFLSLVLFFYMSGEVRSQTINFNNSPYNMDNSINNMENSPRNMRNSPYNMENSPNNLDSKNGIFDNQGNRTGYQVISPSGVTNYYDNKGNRTGYTPSQR
jgi:predicted PurR-regulated permease PerM